MTRILGALLLALFISPAFAQDGSHDHDEIEALRKSLAEIADTAGRNTAAIEDNSARIEELENGTPVPPEPPDPPPTEPGDYEFDPPILNNPIIVRVGVTGAPNGQYNFGPYPKDRDVYFIMPDTPRLQPMAILGGRNSCIGAGEIDLTNHRIDWMSRALLISPGSGETFVEKMFIEVGGKEADAMALRPRHSGYGPQDTSLVTFQDILVQGIRGRHDGVHGDILQTQFQWEAGQRVFPTGNIQIERLVGSTGYNGFVLTSAKNKVHMIDVHVRGEDVNNNSRNIRFDFRNANPLILDGVTVDATMWATDPASRKFVRDMTAAEVAAWTVSPSTVNPRIKSGGSVRRGNAIFMDSMPDVTGHVAIAVPDEMPVDRSEIGIGTDRRCKIN